MEHGRGTGGAGGRIRSPAAPSMARGRRARALADTAHGPTVREAVASASLPGGGLGRGDSSIRVLVSSTDGDPIARATVEVEGHAGRRTLATAADGGAELSGIASGRYAVRVCPPPFASVPAVTSRDIDLAAGESLEIRLEVPEPGTPISGRVLDGDGAPVEGIEIDARPSDTFASETTFTLSSPHAPARSGPDGAFLIERLAGADYVLLTGPTALYPRRRVQVPAGRSDGIDIFLREERTLVISGTVSSPNGAPVPRAEIESSTGHSVTSGPDGSYRLEVQHERGAVELIARKQGYTQGRLLIAASRLDGSETLEAPVVLHPLEKAGELTGRITSVADGKPLSGEVIHLQSASSNAEYRARSGVDGAYRLVGIRPAADYRLQVNSAHSHQDFSRAPMEVRGGPQRLDIGLLPLENGDVLGRMVDPAGRPVPRLTLWVGSQAASAVAKPVTAGPDGRFEVEDVPAGMLAFGARAEPWVSIRGLRLEPGERKDVELVVGLGEGALAGTVTDKDRIPIPNARVALRWSHARAGVESTVFHEAASDAEGRFTFSSLSAGSATLTIRAEGYRESRRRRELTGKSDEMAIELEPAPKRARRRGRRSATSPPSRPRTGHRRRRVVLVPGTRPGCRPPAAKPPGHDISRTEPARG